MNHNNQKKIRWRPGGRHRIFLSLVINYVIKHSCF